MVNHYTSITWKVICAANPPPRWKGGYPAFMGSIIIFVGIIFLTQEVRSLTPPLYRHRLLMSMRKAAQAHTHTSMHLLKLSMAALVSFTCKRLCLARTDGFMGFAVLAFMQSEQAYLTDQNENRL